MNEETRTFPLYAIMTLTTGIGILPVGETSMSWRPLAEVVDFVLGTMVSGTPFTFAEFEPRVTQELLRQHPALKQEQEGANRLSSMPLEAQQGWLLECIERHGERLEVTARPDLMTEKERNNPLLSLLAVHPKGDG